MLSVTTLRQPEPKMPILVQGLLIAVAGLGIWMAAQAAVIPAKAVVAQILLNSAFEASQASGTAQKPWPWADMAPVARLRVPRLGVDQIVLSGGTGEAMAFGPTVLPGTAALGRPGTSVLTAHRDTHFAFLEDLKTGDTITVADMRGNVHDYKVTGNKILHWAAFSLGPADNQPGLALATCYPFDSITSGPNRYVVRATAVSPKPLHTVPTDDMSQGGI